MNINEGAVSNCELQLRPVPRLSAKDAVTGLHLPMRIPVNTREGVRPVFESANAEAEYLERLGQRK
jgi:hypothetical protein